MPSPIFLPIYIMKKIIFALALAVVSACCPKIYPSEKTDSVRIEIHERIDTVIATVTIEKEVERIVTRDTVSRLENTYAKSEAVVSGGYLRHSLESIPQYIKVPVTVTVHDTTYVEKKAETIVEKVNYMTRFQRSMMMVGWAAIAAVIGIIGFWIVKKFVLKL